MTTPTSPVEMDYTNRDFDSIRTFLVSAARGFMPEWITVGEPADFGTLLIELYAYVGDTLNYYIDRVAAEPFLASAVRRQSILGIAQMLGYNPITQQAATGVVAFSLTDLSQYLTSTLVIPAGTVVQTPASESTGAISFETIGTAVLGNGVTTVNVGAQEGRTVPIEWLAISNGAPLQEYVLRYQGVIHRSLTLTVQETDQVADPTSATPQALAQQWTFVDNLVDTDPDASVFTTYIDDQQFTHVVFGDNVAGRIPPTGATIQVSYRYGAGAIGNVAPSQISVISPPITFVAVNNVAAFSGGADNESIDSMRHGIPRASKIKNRAITLVDFADLAFQVPGVGKATATGAFYTQVKVYIAPVGGGYPSTDLLNQVKSYLLDRTLVGTTVEMHPVNSLDYIYTRVKVTMIVHVLPQYGQLTVVNAVKQAVQGVFSFDNPNIDFGSLVSRGEVFHAAINVTGVDWIELTQMVPLDDAGNPVGTATIQDVQMAATRIPTALDADLTITGTGGLT
jgi:hypothetical protein